MQDNNNPVVTPDPTAPVAGAVPQQAPVLNTDTVSAATPPADMSAVVTETPAPETGAETVMETQAPEMGAVTETPAPVAGPAPIETPVSTDQPTAVTPQA